MKTIKPTGATGFHGLFAVALLLATLAVLFGKSFLPDYVHFSNDGPLGQQYTAWMRLPAAFTGCWADTGSIGGNAGVYPLDLTGFISWILGPMGFARFSAPVALFILGLGAWTFFRQLKLAPLAAILGALATALSSSFFACACWGVASQEIAIGLDFFALALVVSNTPETPALIRWTRLALAGLAVGLNVMEAADIGAIFSLFVAAFVLFKALAEDSDPGWLKWTRGVGSVAVITLFAGFLAFQTVVSLVSSQIQGIAGTAQDTETKTQHWNWATQWSEPKVETLGLFVPGLFGYRMNTPRDMMEIFEKSYEGGSYWGGVGRDPELDGYFDGGRTGPAPQGIMRFTGGGNYVGILVALVAFWTVAQSLRRQNSVFTATQQRLIWFWAVVLIGSLLLAYGRFAPFYKILYALPYFSTIRNPTKFLLVFSWAIVILFAYGIHALSQRYLEVPATPVGSLLAQLKKWWTPAPGFDRNWMLACALIIIGSLFGWMIYAWQKPGLVRYLQMVGFPDDDTAGKLASFSISQVGWFVVLFALSAGFCLFIISGILAGRRAWLGGLLLGLLLVVDLGRADLPYIIHWDYKQKYASNPVIDFLRNQPYEHRVAELPFRTPPQFELIDQLYHIEWMQHQFPYYNVQSLDVVQMPRMPADLEAYERALAARNTPDSLLLIARHWELTNVRYLLGAAGFLDVLNERLDPLQHRFRIVQRFAITLKPGIEEFHQRLEELTAVPTDRGDYALFEFTGALPRAKLYSNWQVSTNDSTTLQTLTSTNFDPWQTVLVSTPLPAAPASTATNTNSGTVEYKSYAPTDIQLEAQADTPTVLLLNDKFDPHWQVLVDGKPAELLRCNFIMRGVCLNSGTHTVEFQFSPPHRLLYVTFAAYIAGILLCGFLFFVTRRQPGTAA